MMHPIRVCLLVVALCLLTGCDTLNGPSGPTLLRVENRSQTDFTSVFVQFTDEPTHYGAVDVGAFSGYRSFETAYRYGLVEARAADTTYRLQPIDYVGESPLGAGRYTYRLTLEDGHFGLTLVRDRSD
jgi:hypothetical protein